MLFVSFSTTVVGAQNQFESYGGIVSSFKSRIAAPYSNVLGGYKNDATGDYAVIIGGANNEANGKGTVVSGGQIGYAGGIYSVVNGGRLGAAMGIGSVTVGREDIVADVDFDVQVRGLILKLVFTCFCLKKDHVLTLLRISWLAGLLDHKQVQLRRE